MAPSLAGTPGIVAAIRDATGGTLPINACGGIFTAADARACLAVGAATVQVYTGLIYEGPVGHRGLAASRVGSVPIASVGSTAARVAACRWRRQTVRPSPTSRGAR